MSNPLFNALGGQPMNQYANMIKQFQNFKKTFDGNPKDAVMNMLQSGRISQDQLNQIQSMVAQFKDILK